MGDDSFSGKGFALRKGSRQDPGALEMSLGTALRARCAAISVRRWHVERDVRQPAPAGGTSGPMCDPNAPISFSHRHLSAQFKRTSPLFDLIFLALRAPHAIASPQISHIAVEVPI